ncbi:MAG: UTP--glucose-1-phosphate uridylyltransferase [Clostridia bacterium]|nr:UTP--glucose-1-phosphate uridylyltransferase [Clostridia bacterium]
MEYCDAQRLLEEHGQEQLLQYYDELDEAEKKQLLADIAKINFNIVESKSPHETKIRGHICPVEAVSMDVIAKRRDEFYEAGKKAIVEGKVAAVLLAGGQGSRLGFHKPKGMYNMGLTKNLSIFELQFRNILKVAHETAYFHIFIMTSRQNHDETVEYFRSVNFFGYPEEKIHFYIQDVSPACGYDYKVFLDTKCHVALSPNGNGGWYSSLIRNGLGDVVHGNGIEWINVYAVDNVLQKICDPVFIGATILKGVKCGAKVVKKAYAGEKVGVLCLENDKPAIIEYYEMPENLKSLTDENGELVYRWGVILNYLFDVEILDDTIRARLPYHAAEKAIAHMENGERVTPSKPCGYKFETLVVDMVKRMGSCLAYEVDREKEFAPVKNATGLDSVESARELLIKNGVEL